MSQSNTSTQGDTINIKLSRKLLFHLTANLLLVAILVVFGFIQWKTYEKYAEETCSLLIDGICFFVDDNNTSTADDGATGKMPTYEGVMVMLADGETGNIFSSTGSIYKGKNLVDLGVLASNITETDSHEHLIIDGMYYYSSARRHGPFIVMAIENRQVAQKSFGWMLLLDILVMCVVEVIIVHLLKMSYYSAHKDVMTRVETNHDPLTGLNNRRGYEDDLLKYDGDLVPKEEDFMYASIGINGLKAFNDSYGQEAGDNLVNGAAACIKRVFEPYGKVYRVGGDEFVAMIFAKEAEEGRLDVELQESVRKWCRTTGTDLSLSSGIVSKRKYPDKTVREMANIASEKMLDSRKRYFESSGIDRRKR